jgi:hypothetical protein
METLLSEKGVSVCVSSLVHRDGTRSHHNLEIASFTQSTTCPTAPPHFTDNVRRLFVVPHVQIYHELRDFTLLAQVSHTHVHRHARNTNTARNSTPSPPFPPPRSSPSCVSNSPHVEAASIPLTPLATTNGFGRHCERHRGVRAHARSHPFLLLLKLLCVRACVHDA